MRPTRALIHTDRFRRNLRLVRRRIGADRCICVAVKADAYGHGAVELSRIALEEGATHLAVATVDEAAELRDAGFDCPVVLLGLTVPEEWPRIAELGLEPFVSDRPGIVGLAAAARAAGRTLGLHLKVDTGMGRIGCPPDEAPELASLAAETPGVVLRGTATHFPVADSSDPAYTRDQTDRFRRAVEAIRSRGVDTGLVHAANSGAIIAHDEAFFGMVRPGIMLYGYYPSREQERTLPLEPVMELRSKIVFLKTLRAGTPVSYGLTWSPKRDTVVATVPAGYADGVNRRLSNRGEVAVRGRRVPIVGRVCMDQFLIDLGPGGDAEIGDDVVIFGASEGAPTAEDVAVLLDTIPYEITCRIDRRVPRIYVGG